MRRPGKAGAKAVRPQRSRTLKRGNAAKVGREAPAIGASERIALLEHRLNEALEQQTATSDVLRVISSSPGELKPVFEAILESATRICTAKFANLFLYADNSFRIAAQKNAPLAYAERWRQRPVLAVGDNPHNPLDRLASTKSVINIPDLMAERGYIERNPRFVALVEAAGARTHVAVPMLKEGELIGAISIFRQEVHPFTDKQIELVKNFADQAVIAIQNTRLLNELRQRTDDLSESLEQQTATADVLMVISSSPGELQSVFETIASRSVNLCGATYGIVFRFDGEMISVVAHHNLDQPAMDALNRMYPMRPDRESQLMGQVIMERSILHIRDVAAEPRYTVAATLALGIRSFLGVPMLRDGNPIGGIALYRRKVELFSDRQIELVKAFAAQSVIAIENARLLNDLNKLNQQLEQRVTDQVSEIERMSRLRRFLPPQVADLIVASGAEKQLESHRREITALFCDLRGFTGFSESSDPEDVIALLREYHAAIGEIINTYGGTLERYDSGPV